MFFFSKIENSNAVHTWNHEDYKAANIKFEFYEKKDFKTEMKANDKSIDFNDVSAYENVQPSTSNLVTIHKRNGSPELCQDFRKKYRVIPNQFLPEKQQKMSQDSEVEIIEVKQEVLLITDSPLEIKPNVATNEIHYYQPNMGPPATRPKEILTMQIIEQKANNLPLERIALIKEIKLKVPSDKYKIFLTAISEYRRKLDIEVFFGELKKAFDKKEFFYMMKGMRRFLKECHRPIFDELSNNFIKIYVPN